jgi:hypothetical protein
MHCFGHPHQKRFAVTGNGRRRRCRDHLSLHGHAGARGLFIQYRLDLFFQIGDDLI